MDYGDVMSRLESLGDPRNVAGMARYGITPRKAFGISIPHLRKLAREVATDRALARRLWSAGYRETRILASMIDDADRVTEAQMERWAKAFAYWEICDQVCMNLFQNTRFAWAKAAEWARREEEFVKRAGFVLMARLAVTDKGAPDEEFERLLPLIMREAADDRRNVRKGVSWALRQIGKRSPALHARAIDTAATIRAMDSKAARWIASDVLRELTSDAVRTRLQRRGKGR